MGVEIRTSTTAVATILLEGGAIKVVEICFC
jgi:hypothetical protein